MGVLLWARYPYKVMNGKVMIFLVLEVLQVFFLERGPLGPLGFNYSQHGPTTRPSIERTAEKAFLRPDRV